ncbi:methyltransferase type 11 [Chlorella sorokiniana]|uniref:Methyltransferase type 11 n=1 Tax=Chlorella sorokiniana TaxID=3076 RepID=A0A2P6TS77_CHLSO|nr:methyltransferase type 11 [Chlorella sorokiniana]|eukprot:PRW56921.1 methyltransferase type 11 [Chlorella sorokiniana]
MLSQSLTHAAQAPAAARPARRSRGLQCRAQAATGTVVPPRPKNELLVGLVEALFKFPPFFAFAAKNARAMIVKRGEKMGMDFQAEIDALRSVDWDEEVAAARDPTVKYPSYYKKPFHAYPDGNLAMEPALEMTVAARSVHSVVYDPEGKKLDPEGDAKLRSTFNDCTKVLLEEQGARPVQDILDVGAATGLSSLALLKAFPGSQVTGIDLSPHMIAVGRYLQRQRNADQAAAGQQPEQLRFVHGAGEDTRLPDGCMDLVSIMLVCHELPAAASQAIFAEAFRVLRPGGALAVMEMNPASPIFQRIFSNPFPYVAFKSTEPWLLEYLSLDMPGAMTAAGFLPPRQLENSPRHKTVVAVKPQQ